MKPYHLFIIPMILLSCSKKPDSTEGQPSPAPTPPTAPAIEEVFDFPPPPKKQAKYFPEGTSSRAIQDLDDMLDSYILSPKTPRDQSYNLALKKKVIQGTFDIRELCRLALEKHWGERTAQEQDYFVDLMIRLLEKKAIFSKEQGQKREGTKALYKVTYEGDRPLDAEKKTSLAKSLVHVPSESLKIGLDYRLKRAGDTEWKIFDVIVDGASLLDNYKYQFDKIIAKDGYPVLIHRMESKLKDLEEKEKKAL